MTTHVAVARRKAVPLVAYATAAALIMPMFLVGGFQGKAFGETTSPPTSAPVPDSSANAPTETPSPAATAREAAQADTIAADTTQSRTATESPTATEPTATAGTEPTGTTATTATTSSSTSAPEPPPTPAQASDPATTSGGSRKSAIQAAASPARLATAGDSAILGGSTITNTGRTTIVGDVGLHPGTAVPGFAPCTPTGPADCVVLTGALHVADGVALQAKTDLVNAYNGLLTRESSCTSVNVALDRGTSYLPGVYCSPGTFDLVAGGTVTLDAQGNPDAEFIFLTGAGGSTLVTGAASRVLLIGGAQACNVYWQVASSATIGANTAFVGNILAAQSIQLQTGATLEGRALAQDAAVTLDTNTITRANCQTVTTPPPTGGGGGGGGVTPPVDVPPVITPVSTGTPGSPGFPSLTTGAPGSPGVPALTTGGPGVPVTRTSRGPGVPAVVGPPRTGGAPLPEGRFPWTAVLLASLFGGAGTVAVALRRRTHSDVAPTTDR